MGLILKGSSEATMYPSPRTAALSVDAPADMISVILGSAVEPQCYFSLNEVGIYGVLTSVKFSVGEYDGTRSTWTVAYPATSVDTIFDDDTGDDSDDSGNLSTPPANSASSVSYGSPAVSTSTGASPIYTNTNIALISTSIATFPISTSVGKPPEPAGVGNSIPVVNLSTDGPDAQYVAGSFDCLDEGSEFNPECWSVLNINQWLPQ